MWVRGRTKCVAHPGLRTQICYSTAVGVWDACHALPWQAPFATVPTLAPQDMVPHVLEQLMVVLFQALGEDSLPSILVGAEGDTDCYAPGAHQLTSQTMFACPTPPSFDDVLAVYKCVLPPYATLWPPAASHRRELLCVCMWL